VLSQEPTIPQAERLELLRLKHLQSMSLAEFHRRLTSSNGYSVSYAAVRNYHSHRKAPVDYYAQVSRIFGIRLEWILFGEGEMTSQLEAKRKVREGDTSWIDEIPETAPTIWDPSDQVAQSALLECVRRLDLARPESMPLSGPEKRTIVKLLDTLVGGTLWILRGDREVPPSFVRAVLLALLEGIPKTGKGSSQTELLKRMRMR